MYPRALKTSSNTKNIDIYSIICAVCTGEHFSRMNRVGWRCHFGEFAKKSTKREFEFDDTNVLILNIYLQATSSDPIPSSTL